MSSARIAWRPPIMCALPALLIACAPVTREGLELMVSDRPSFTESTQTVTVGMRQLEAGGTFARRLDEESTSVGETILRVGLLPQAELRIGLNSYTVARSPGEIKRGIEDLSLGTKVRLVNGDEGSWKPDVAVIVATTLPTGADAIGASRPQPEARMGLSWDLTSRLTASSNLNAAYVADDDAAYTELAATGTIDVTLTRRTALFLELFSVVPQRRGTSASHYANGGLTFLLTDNLQFDVRSGIGLRRIGGPDYFIGAGISRRW